MGETNANEIAQLVLWQMDICEPERVEEIAEEEVRLVEMRVEPTGKWCGL